MKLSDIGEFGLINRFAKQFSNFGASNTLGIGDDCAILPLNENESYIVSTDLLIEDIHFLRNKITPFELGYKSLAVNLSDIAAMGGQPQFSFLSIAIPKDVEVEYLDQFIEGYHQLSSKYNTNLMGGDTTKSVDRLAINVLVVGKIENNKIKLRSDAQTNDIICVTGNLGDSAGGLQILLDQLPVNQKSKQLLDAHHLPEPRIKEGLFLSQFKGVHAMMDISDGIASDLRHILNASKQSATIELQSLPTSEVLQQLAKEHYWDITQMATSGGEDYELILTIDSNYFEGIAPKFYQRFQKPLYKIGTITEGMPKISWTNNGKKIETNQSGFNHFKS